MGRSAAHGSLLANPKSARTVQLSQQKTSYNDSLHFWTHLDESIVSELEAHVSSTFNPIQQPHLSGDILFGLATAIFSNRTPGFQKKSARYVAYAAMSSIPAAQGIAGRLLFLNSSMEPMDDATTTNWLRSAVSSGSLIAEEDLATKNPEYCRQAKQRFRACGGYNARLDNTKLSAALSCTGARSNDDNIMKICEQTKAIDDPVDFNGNTLLHYAAAFGLCDLISYLIHKRGALSNLLNGNGESALYRACLSGHTAVVRGLIALGADPALASEPFGVTCIHWLSNSSQKHVE